MFGIKIIEKYAKEGGVQTAKEVRDIVLKGSPLMSEENTYALMRLTGRNYKQAVDTLIDDADDDVEYSVTYGEDEDAFYGRMPYTKWHNTLVFGTKVEAEKKYNKLLKEMTGEQEWVRPIAKYRKSEKEAKEKVANLRYELSSTKERKERYEKEIEKMNKRLPDLEKEVNEAEAEFEKKFGYKFEHLW